MEAFLDRIYRIWEIPPNRLLPPKKNDFAVHDFASLSPSALTELPRQEPLCLAQGLLCFTYPKHFAAHYFAKKSHFLLSFLNIFPILLSNAPCLLPLSPRPCSKFP